MICPSPPYIPSPAGKSTQISISRETLVQMLKPILGKGSGMKHDGSWGQDWGSVRLGGAHPHCMCDTSTISTGSSSGNIRPLATSSDELAASRLAWWTHGEVPCLLPSRVDTGYGFASRRNGSRATPELCPTASRGDWHGHPTIALKK